MNPYVSAFFTLLLVHRAYTHRSLTYVGILSAVVTAIIQSTHPTALPFTLLLCFYMLATTATKVKKAEKDQLTISSGGGHESHDGTRGPIQVIANSGMATLFCLVDLAGRAGWLGGTMGPDVGRTGWFEDGNVWWGQDLVVVGIVANYTAVTADTLSSELGILSGSPPRLITNPFRICPKGTNGGVSLLGLFAAFAGSVVLGVISSLWFYPPLDTNHLDKVGFIFFTAFLGLAGTLLDSLLGATLQLSVVDVRTGKVVEHPHGERVLVYPSTTSSKSHLKPEGGSRKVVQGSLGWLDNNGVNFTAAAGTSLLGIGLWCILMKDS